MQAVGDWWTTHGQPISRAALTDYLTALLWSGIEGVRASADLPHELTRAHERIVPRATTARRVSRAPRSGCTSAGGGSRSTAASTGAGGSSPSRRVAHLLRSGRRDVEVRIADRVRAARLAEVDPWGGVRITGVGDPPWPPVADPTYAPELTEE